MFRFALTFLFVLSFCVSAVTPLYAQSVPGASEKQISEAKRAGEMCEKYYKTADCSCVAEEFLKARVALGVWTSFEEAWSKIPPYKCFKDMEPFDSPPDVSQASEALRAESQDAFEECKKDVKLYRYYDCECYADKYLEGRLKLGPLAQRESVFSTLRDICRDIEGSKEMEYSSCIARVRSSEIQGLDPKDYCACTADKWEELFESYQGRISGDSKNNFRHKAHNHCMKTLKK